MRWSQVDFAAGHITVGKAKTEAGAGRAIPMSATLRAVLEHHAAFCALKLGPIQPGWFVFPFSNTKKPVDANRPATSLKTAWKSIKTTTGVTRRLHDLRHSFCTEPAEAGVPESTMLDMMGHVSIALLRRYSISGPRPVRTLSSRLSATFQLGSPRKPKSRSGLKSRSLLFFGVWARSSGG